MRLCDQSAYTACGKANVKLCLYVLNNVNGGVKSTTALRLCAVAFAETDMEVCEFIIDNIFFI